jgi:hypothetical protein
LESVRQAKPLNASFNNVLFEELKTSDHGLVSHPRAGRSVRPA